MEWTDERLKTAIKMWNAGYTGGEIAERLGWVSRSAVIGKLHRMGIKRGKYEFKSRRNSDRDLGIEGVSRALEQKRAPRAV